MLFVQRNTRQFLETMKIFMQFEILHSFQKIKNLGFPKESESKVQ